MEIIKKSNHVYAMDKNNPPVLKVPGGSEVEFETYDCFKEQISNCDQRIDDLDWTHINPATGPLYVEDAMPGDVLKVTIKGITINNKGVIAAIPGAGLLGDKVGLSSLKVLEIEDGCIGFNEDISIRVSPMIGVIGVAPSGDPVPCGIPGSHGGNMDNKMIKEGTTLYLPVYCEGGLLSIGDLHAVMGDGEIMVSGVEVSGKVVVEVDVIKGIWLKNPLHEDEGNYYTIASHKDLLSAIRISTEDMLDLVSRKYNLSFNDSGMLLSAIGNAQICQVVDPLLTARFSMPKSILKDGLLV